MKPTISEGLSWMKTLKARHAELVSLRNQNSQKVQQDYNGHTTVVEPMYNVKALDIRVAKLAREMRLLDQAIKRANAKVVLEEYTLDDSILGELELPTE